ncbi:MAG: hypothetical protein GY720_00175 [bacterium]|nr:hypothetical protein [bacterium]
MTDHDLEALEQRTFRTVTDDGLWDVWIAAFFTMFAVAPLLSETMGDFWSVVIFLPFWLAVYLVIRIVRLRVVNPRVGTVRFGTDRRRRLRKLSIVMLIVNVLAAVLGAVAAIGVQMDWLDLGSGSIGYPLGLGIVVLVGFSGAAHVTGIPRYYLYGLMLAIATLIGEWLWREDLATHHGYPIVFGAAAAVIFIGGIARFMAVLRSHPLPQHPATV